MTDAQAIEEARLAIGRQRVIEDGLSPESVGKLAVLLGMVPPETVLPPTWHWIFFNRPVAEADQGEDLHERTGLFLPAAPFPRRMWAAGEVEMHRPLRIGVPAIQRITVADVVHKSGRTGEMCFVTLALEMEQAGSHCISETRTIVYRDRGTPEPALRAPGDPVPEGFSTYSDGKLFFYSAVTHNGHRIHWDRHFCREIEGYPDLVVHGPMMATELCDALRSGAPINSCRYSYRAQAPVFTTTPVRIEPGPTGPDREGLIRRSDGVVSMTGRLQTL